MVLFVIGFAIGVIVASIIFLAFKAIMYTHGEIVILRDNTEGQMNIGIKFYENLNLNKKVIMKIRKE